MNQNIWGPNLWFSLHTMSFTYPLKPSEQDKKNYKTFFESLQFTIPCSVCRKNYIRHLKESPIDPNLESRKLLVHWLIDIHNMVNGETGKKILSYDTVIRKYEKVYGKKLVLEGTQDMDENEESLSYNLMYENHHSIHHMFSSDFMKFALLFFFFILVICYCKRFYK